MKTWASILILLLSLPAQPAPAENIFEKIDKSVGQIIEVKTKEAGGFKTTLRAWQRDGDHFNLVAEPFEAVIGRNGLAPLGEKKEGDGRTPSGVYRIKMAFGYESAAMTALDYAQVDATDLWVDDPDSPDYNRWVKAPTQAKSFERLKRDDELYELAVVIEYNTESIVPGAGSAIFMHIYRNGETPTAGCVALAKDHLIELLSWLDKSQNPVIVLGENN